MRFHSATVPVALFCAIPAAVALIAGFIAVRFQMFEASAAQENPAARAEATPEDVADDAETRAEPGKPAAVDEIPPTDTTIDFFPETRTKEDLELLAARLTGEQGEQDLAQRRARVTERTRNLGPEHADTIAARRAFASELYYFSLVSGDPDLLREHEKERRAILALVVRLHGAGDYATFRDRAYLARASQHLGNHTQAAEEYRALAAAAAKALGPEEGEALEARQALAASLHDAGQYAEAEREYRALIAIRERIPGTGVHNLDQLRFWHAMSLEKAGRHAEAEVEHRLVLAATEKQSGATGNSALIQRKWLAECLLAQGKAREAIRELEFVQAHWEEVSWEGSIENDPVARLLAEARQALAESEKTNPAPAPAEPE